MAVRQNVPLKILNQENAKPKMTVTNPKVVAKPAFRQPVNSAKMRPALMELVCTQANAKNNKLTNAKNNCPVKKVAAGPTLKKPVVPIKKETHAPANKLLLRKPDQPAKIVKLEGVKSAARSYSSKQMQIVDPDESSKNDPQMVTEYLPDIFCHLRALELEFPVRENYLAEGHETTPKMRAMVVNWLVEVHLNFKLYLETLHLCVSVLDRYLQENKTVGRGTLQLVGISAMFVASKIEEMYLPDLDDYVYMCDNAFSKEQIFKMEREILKKLNFSFGKPLSLHFLRRYNKIAQVKSEHHVLGKYLLELALVEYSLAHVRPSIQAAASCCLSIAILNETMDLSKVWTPTLVHYTTYEYADFRSVIVEMAHMLVRAETSPYQATKKKYSSASCGKISLNPKLSGLLVRKLTSKKQS